MKWENEENIANSQGEWINADLHISHSALKMVIGQPYTPDYKNKTQQMEIFAGSLMLIVALICLLYVKKLA